jgi:hypothetical protein
MKPIVYTSDPSKTRQTQLSSPKLFKIHATKPINNPKSTTCPPQNKSTKTEI